MASSFVQSRKHAEQLLDTLQHQYQTTQVKLNAAWQDTNTRPKLILVVVLVTTTSLWLAITLLLRPRTRKRQSTTPPSTPTLSTRSPFKAAERIPGEWTPSPFTRPHTTPYPSWSLTHTKPLPYHPFRHGPKYNITMGLRPMHWDEWIELDNEFLSYHALKTARIAQRGDKCCRTAPEAHAAARELLEELCAYLPERYPGLYAPLAGRQGVQNHATGEVIDVAQRLAAGEDPMQICARLVQDDLAIMLARPDGQYYLLAGAILLAGFWRLEDKFGMELCAIHTSGDVPAFREKLERGMRSLFGRMRPEKPVLRHNYFIQVDGELAWSRSLGDEDGEAVGWDSADKVNGIETVYFRSERQSLRRLPRSGGIVFTIRTYFHPITEICKEPYVPGRLASAVRSWGDDVSRYKGKAQYADVLLEYLDMMHAKQVEDGLDLSKEDEIRAYPY